MRRVLQSISSIVFSLLLGAVALALTAIYAPDTLELFQINAGFLKDDILLVMTNLGTKSNVNVWVRFLVQDEQLVFMGFVIAVRVVLAFVYWGLFSAYDILTGGPARE